jgi:hypothetical protein
MPAKSPKQQRYMGMVAHNPSKVRNKKDMPSKKVAREFSHKPKGGYRKSGRKK